VAAAGLHISLCMVETARANEWRVIEGLLPQGWREAAWGMGAFRRARDCHDVAGRAL
jgi:hypothetical protein